MGNTTSIMEGSILESNIKKEVQKIINDYKFWTNTDICKSMELIYYNKLLHFDDSSLLDASMSIGIKADNTVDKKMLCNKIVKHYKRRIDILTKIINAIEMNKTKIMKVTSGDVCRNINGYVENELDCEKNKGTWYDKDKYSKKLKEIRNSDKYDDWVKYMSKLKEKNYQYLKLLFDIVKKIKNDINKPSNDSSFDVIEKYALNTIDKMNSICDVVYLILINS